MSKEKEIFEKPFEAETKTTEEVNPFEGQQSEVAVTKNLGFKDLVLRSKKTFTAQLNLPEKEAESLFNRELSFALMYYNNMSDKAKPFFNSCMQKNPASLSFAIANVASSGLTLDPNLKLAYLVPRDSKIIFQSSYMGKREIILQSGLVRNILVHLVRDMDFFEVEYAPKTTVKHRPANPFGNNKVIGGYAVTTLTNGEIQYDFMSIEEIRKVQKTAQTQAVWNAWDDEMIKKTILNRAFKNIPKLKASPELLNLIKYENENDPADLSKVEKKQENIDLFID